MADGPELDVLLKTEQTFEPPEDFAAQANISDPEVYEKAAADPEGWWASWAEKLDWIEPWDEVLDWSDPPFARWFGGGRLNASANCLDRHVEAGLRRPGRPSLGGGERRRAGRGRAPRGHLLRAARDRAAGRKRAQGAGRWQGRRGRDLHADGPRGCRRDARHGADRGDPQRRLRRLLRRLGEGADGGLRREGPDHRRRDPAPRRAGTDEGQGGRDPRRPAGDGARDRRRPLQDRPADAGGARRLLARGRGGRRCGVRAGADGCRGPALHPLHLRLDREAEGDPAHDRRLPDAGRRHAQHGLRPEARVRRLLVRRGHRLGDRPLLHRLRAARQRRHQRPLRGGSELPEGGPLVGDHRALRGDDLLHRPDRDPRLHEVGQGASRGA